MQGEELRERRKAMRLTQADLAAALSLTQTFIGMMERGEKPIEIRTALAVKYLTEHPEARPAHDMEQNEE